MELMLVYNSEHSERVACSKVAEYTHRSSYELPRARLRRSAERGCSFASDLVMISHFVHRTCRICTVIV